MSKKAPKHDPLVTEGPSVVTKLKNKLNKRRLRHPTAWNKIGYAKYRYKLTKLLRKRHRNYYDSLIQQNKNNINKT